jgi:hypothetical protein
MLTKARPAARTNQTRPASTPAVCPKAPSAVGPDPEGPPATTAPPQVPIGDGTPRQICLSRPCRSVLTVSEARGAPFGQYALVDEAELRRRIEVYLVADLPGFSEAARVADALAPRLFQYIRQSAEEAPTASTTLDALLPADALVFFGASWDGNTQRYRSTVQQAAGRLGRRVVEVDVDDPVGSAIAAVFSVVSTPAVAVAVRGSPIIGERALDDLVASLEAST